MLLTCCNLNVNYRHHARMLGVCPSRDGAVSPVIGPEWCLKDGGGSVRRAFDNSTSSQRRNRREGLRQVLPCGCSHYGLLHVTKGVAQVTMQQLSHYAERFGQNVTYFTDSPDARQDGTYLHRCLISATQGRHRTFWGKKTHPFISDLINGCESSNMASVQILDISLDERGSSRSGWLVYDAV